MAEPIIEQIAAKIAAKLATITVAAGYQQTVAGVVRPSRYASPVTMQNNLVILSQLDPAEISGPLMFKTWRQPFAADLCLRPSDASSTALDLLANRFRADVEKVFMSNRTWDGLAINSSVGAPKNWLNEDSGFEGLTVMLNVDYRTRELDPYTQT